jgi:hypothetical protein
MNDTPVFPLETPSDPQVESRKATFSEWLRVAKPGDEFVYFVGHSLGSATPEEDVEAKAALQAFANGLIELAQRRIKKPGGIKSGRFEYLAQKRHQIRPPLVFGEPFRVRLPAEQRMSVRKK